MVTTTNRTGTPDALTLTAHLATQRFSTADEALQAVLVTLQRITGLQSVLMSQIGKADSTLQIVAAHNTDPALTIPAGLKLPLTMSPCLRVAGADEPFVMADLREDAELAVLPATKDMGVCAYVGVPILRADGSFFGTLVALDTAPQDQLSQHVPWMQILAKLAASQLERQATPSGGGTTGN
jgi:sigma-B regulation protein RsbU (phosphoserine phosphatase)